MNNSSEFYRIQSKITSEELHYVRDRKKKKNNRRLEKPVIRLTVNIK